MNQGENLSDKHHNRFSNIDQAEKNSGQSGISGECNITAFEVQ